LGAVSHHPAPIKFLTSQGKPLWHWWQAGTSRWLAHHASARQPRGLASGSIPSRPGRLRCRTRALLPSVLHFHHLRASKENKAFGRFLLAPGNLEPLPKNYIEAVLENRVVSKVFRIQRLQSASFLAGRQAGRESDLPIRTPFCDLQQPVRKDR